MGVLRTIALVGFLGCRLAFAAVTTPNMNLQQPTIGVDSGLVWEQDVNANAAVIDQHNHTPGNGVQIPPAGLNINSNLGFNGNSAVALQATVYTPQTILSSLGALYVIGPDLYYNDFNGNVIKITSGGAVNATSSGIVSGTATASFVSSVLVVNAASNTPANIQGGSILLGNNVSGSKFLTLSPPSAMSSNYSLTLPQIPSSTRIMTLDTSGNMAANVGTDNTTIQISSNNLQVVPGGITNTQLAAQAVDQQSILLRTAANTVGPGGTALSNDISFVTSSSSFVGVTNASVTLTTLGNPVVLMLVPRDFAVLDSLTLDWTVSGTGSYNVGAYFKMFRGVSPCAQTLIQQNDYAGAPVGYERVDPIGVLSFIDFPVAGTYTYTMQTAVLAFGVTSSPSITITGRLVAYEVK